MFESNDINFLPPKMRAKEKEEQKKARSFPTRSQFPYSKPSQALQKEPESKIIPEGLKSKTGFFQKLGHFFRPRKKLTKNQKSPKSIPPNFSAKISPGKLYISEPSLVIPKKFPPPAPPPPSPKPPSPPPEKPIAPKEKPKTNFVTSPLPTDDKLKSASVNLIPDDIATRAEFRSKLLILGITLFVVAIIIALSFFAVRLYGESYLTYHNIAKEQLALIEERIKLYHEYQLESQRTTDKIKTVSELIKNHLTWSNFFKILEGVTYADARFSNFQGDITGQVAVDVTTNNLADFIQQMLILKNSNLIEVYDFSGLSITREPANEAEGKEETEEISFGLIIKFKPEVFIQH